MNFTAFLLRNKFVFNLLSLFVIIAGATALFQIPREAFPNVNFDTVVVGTIYPGGNASQIEKLITHPIEKELKDVDDIKEMTSTSSEGLSLITLKIEPEAKNKDRVINDIQRAVDRVSDLPADLNEKPKIYEFKVANQPIMELALSGPFSQLELQDWARKLEERLLDIPDISTVRRRGYYEPQYHILISPEKLDKYHLSLAEVGQMLARRNVNVPGGTVFDSSGEIILRATGEFHSPEEMKSLVVRANDGGQSLTLGEIAEISLSHERARILYRTDGERSLILQPIKKADVDIFKLKKEVTEEVEEFKKIAPANLHYAFVNDLSYYVERRLNVLKWNGLIGFLLVMIPIFFFFEKQMAISALLGMPVAFLSTLAVMHFFGISINLLSMFGLIMVIGMLVDEDIVIAENIHRHLQEGKSYWEATVYGTQEVTKAVIATVLTTITAFIPLLLMSGIMGKFVRHIPITVIITLVASLIEALIVLPVHVYSLSTSKDREGKSDVRASALSDKVVEVFGKSLEWLIKRRYAFFGVLLLSLGAVGWLWYTRINFVLFPSEGIEAFFIRTKLAMGTPLEETLDKMRAVENILKKLPSNELDHYVTEAGLIQDDPTDPFTKRGSHLGQLAVFLTPESKRDRVTSEIMDEVRAQVSKGVEGIEELSIDAVPTVPWIGKPVAVRLKGDDFNLLETSAEKVKEILKTLPGVTDITDDYEEGKKEKQVVIDPSKVAMAGLTMTDVAMAVRYAFEGGTVTSVKQGDEDWDVVVKFPEEMRHRPEALNSVKVANPMGNLIPLNQIASFEEGRSVEVIRHFNRKRTITISAQVDQRVTSSKEVNGLLKNKLVLEFGNNPELLVHYGGESEETDESLTSFYRAFGLALFLTFIIIAATVRDAVIPFVLMATILLGLMGVGIGFLLSGSPLSFLALLGLVGMSGIVVDVGILIVDFVHKKQDEGMEPMLSIVEGTKSRFRPIVLTNATTILGIIPSSIGLGGTDPFIQPMAIALNWGIGFGSLASLFVVPVALAVLYDIKAKTTSFKKNR